MSISEMCHQIHRQEVIIHRLENNASTFLVNLILFKKTHFSHIKSRQILENDGFNFGTFGTVLNDCLQKVRTGFCFQNQII